MANPNRTVAKFRQKFGYPEEHRKAKQEAADRRMEASPYVAVFRKVSSGEMTVDEGVAEVERMQKEGK